MSWLYCWDWEPRVNNWKIDETRHKTVTRWANACNFVQQKEPKQAHGSLNPSIPKTLAGDTEPNENLHTANTKTTMTLWCRTVQKVAHNSRTPFSQTTSYYHTIQAIPRECTGSRVSARDRSQGRIPAVVFAQDLLDKNTDRRSPSRKQILSTERKQIHSILKSVELPFFCSTTFPLQIRAGSGSSVLLDSGKVLPIKVKPVCCFLFWFLHSVWHFFLLSW